MARIFQYDGRSFPDPDSRVSPEEVRQHMAQFFPELANAEVRREARGEDEVFTFQRRIGTKGARRRRAPGVVAVLRRVPARELGVFALAADLLGPDGELDLDAAADRQPEINLAVAEAEAYARATGRALEALRRLPPR
jgi:PRTRC genetic system protein C